MEEPISSGVRCNCSFCVRLGIIYSRKISSDNFSILRGEELIKTYLFNDRVVNHSFCSNCGIYVFYTGSQCKVNLGCVEGLDSMALQIEVYDGGHLL